MSYSSATKFYLGALFLLLSSNAVSALFAAVGVRGITFYHIQAVILLACLIHAGVLLLRGRFRIATDRKLVLLVMLSMMYTTVSAVLLLRFSDVAPAYVALMLYTFLVYPLMGTIMLVCERVDIVAAPRFVQFPKWMVWASVAVLLFGWAQFLARDTLLHVTNSENVSKLVESSLLGTFRPPSVFVSSLLFGIFAVFIFCLSAAYTICRRGSIHSCALALLALASVVLSQTRNVYLCGGCAMVTAVALKGALAKPKWLRLVRKLPAAYVAVAASVMLWAVWQFLSSDMQKTGDLGDASSAWARVSGWQTAWQDLVIPGSSFDLLFGYGITQAGQASDYGSLYPARGEGLFIDSTFFNLFLFQGLIGLTFYLVLYWTIWRRLLKRAHQSRNPFTVGLTCFVSAFLALGVLNIVNGQWWGITISLAFLALAAKPSRDAVCAA